jgi:phospholipase/carboxylesterase
MSLETIEMLSTERPGASLIVLHGLGADGHDFVPIAQELDLGAVGGARFVFPHAPMRPVTMNGGFVMRAWYDIAGTPQARREDEAGLRASLALIDGLIERERGRGVPASRIVLMGFSQGCALQRYGTCRWPSVPLQSAAPPMPKCRSSWRTAATTR